MRLEPGEYSQQIEERLAGRCSSIERLLYAADRSTLGLQLAGSALQVAYRWGEPVNPRHHQHVAGPNEVEQGPQFAPALGGGA